MKILMLNYEYPPIGGGGGVISENISGGLSLSGHNITLITTWFPGLKEQESGSVNIVRLKSLRKKAHRSNPVEMYSWIRHAKKYILNNYREKDFDICFANFVIPGGEVGLFLKRKLNLPYVVISHGHDIPWVKPLNLYPLFAVCYCRIKRILMNSEINFVQSFVMKQNVDRFIPKYPNKNVLIRNACSHEMFFPDYSKRNALPHIIFTGRLVRQKNPEVFVKSLAVLRDSGTRFSAGIYGDGPLFTKIQKLIDDSGLNQEILMHGKIPNIRMPDVYQSADIMIAPSSSEGMSISALEALFCGVYVMATNVSGFNEIIEDSGYGELIDKDPEDIARKIREFLETGKEKVFKESFRKIYSWEEVVPLYEKCLNELVP